MSLLGHIGLMVTGAVAALLALAWLHQDLQPDVALLCAIVAWGGAVAVRGAWRHLPQFVTGWLDGGVVVVIALLGAGATLGVEGVPYLVLRWRELAVVSVAAGLAGTAVSVLAYTHHRLAGEVESHVERNAELRRQSLERHFAALSAQVNPHFLFNTLNTLAEVVHEDADLAEELITDLAGLMRFTLESSTKWVTLGDELTLVRRLLRLEEARLPDRLTWSVSVSDDALLEVPIPGLLIQPLVENAVHHGIVPRPEGGRVEIVVTRVDDRVRVQVTDDGAGIPDDVVKRLHEPGRGTAGAGGGLYNAAERTRLAWSAPLATLSVAPTDVGTTLILEFPAGASS